MSWHVKNWNKFQHFKDRRPPWIKLYRDILDDPDWHELDGEDAKRLTMIWVVASEDLGTLPDVRKLAFRLRLSEIKTEQLLNRLSHWLYQDDINVISEQHQVDIPEKERETEREIEEEKESCSNEFERFWEVYPRRVAKKLAEKALTKALRETTIESILDAVRKQRDSWTDPKFIPHPNAWLDAGRWSDQVNGEAKRPLPSSEEMERIRANYYKKQAEAI